MAFDGHVVEPVEADQELGLPLLDLDDHRVRDAAEHVGLANPGQPLQPHRDGFDVFGKQALALRKIGRPENRLRGRAHIAFHLQRPNREKRMPLHELCAEVKDDHQRNRRQDPQHGSESGVGRHPRLRYAFRLAPARIASTRVSKSIPAAAAALGRRLVGVMPGIVLASSTQGRPARSSRTSTRAAPAQPRAR